MSRKNQITNRSLAVALITVSLFLIPVSSIYSQTNQQDLRLEDIFELPENRNHQETNSSESQSYDYTVDKSTLLILKMQQITFLPMDHSLYRDTTLQGEDPEFERRIEMAMSVIDSSKVKQIGISGYRREIREDRLPISEIKNGELSGSKNHAKLLIDNKWEELSIQMILENANQEKTSSRHSLTPKLSDQFELEPGSYAVRLLIWNSENPEELSLVYPEFKFEEGKKYSLELSSRDEEQWRRQLTRRSDRTGEVKLK